MWTTHTGVTKGAVAEGSEVLRVEREQLLSWKLQKKSMPSVSSSYPATWCQWWHVCLPWQWSHWQGSPSLPGTGRAAEGGFLQLQWVLILMDDGRWYLSPKTIFTKFLSVEPTFMLVVVVLAGRLEREDWAPSGIGGRSPGTTRGMGTGDKRSGRDKRLVPGACCYSVVESVISYIKFLFSRFLLAQISIFGV